MSDKPTRIYLAKDRLNNEQTVADYLGVSKDTVARFAKGVHSSGRHQKCITLSTCKRRYTYDDVMNFVNEERA